MRGRFLFSVIAIATSLAGHHAYAQTLANSSKPISIVVPFSAGGSTDALARLARDGMAKVLDEQIIVVNQPGAGGSIAAAGIKRSNADGKHLFLGTIAALSIYPVLYKSRVEYDPIKDFSPVVLAAKLPLVVVVPSTSPFKTLADLTAYLKKNGDAANYASAGNGSSPHLGAELYKNLAKVNAVHVPYQGGSPALLGLASGETTFMVAVVPEARPFIDSGKLRALAVTTKERIPDLPTVPTVSEAGVPNYEITSWYAFVVRAGTPRDTISKLNAALNTALKNKRAAETLNGMGFQVQGGSPEELGELMKKEMKKWQKVVNEADISVR